jgi:predicted SAM-dependent methyltransferase
MRMKIIKKIKNDSKLINIGCGSTIAPGWINIDMNSQSRHVISCNIVDGIPFGDNRFSAVYSSHLLEHLSREKAGYFILECCRVLEPGGIIRIVVPDLESIARAYLQSLDDSIAKNEGADSNYEWMVLELLDQLVRTRSGGEMAQYIREERNIEFVVKRVGKEAAQIFKKYSIRNDSIIRNMLNVKIGNAIIKFKLKLARTMLLIAGGRELVNCFTIGLFRKSGEVHQWMYDRYSLMRLLRNAGFNEVKICRYNESNIPDFNKYNLDSLNGEIRKPDSLFIEAKK